jgi:hypothetical protein
MGTTDRALDPTPILGNWFATDKEATGITELTLAIHDDRFVVRAVGADSPLPQDWGEVEATRYGANVDATEAMAFSAVYDFGSPTVTLAAYAKQGILVLDTFTAFHEADGRSDYFTREFFHR